MSRRSAPSVSQARPSRARALRQAIELLRCLGIALRSRQRASRRTGARRCPAAAGDRYCTTIASASGWIGIISIASSIGPGAVGVVGGSLLRQSQGLRRLAGGEPHAAERHPRRRARGGCVTVGRQPLLEQRGRLLASVTRCSSRGERRDQRRALLGRRRREPALATAHPPLRFDSARSGSAADSAAHRRCRAAPARQARVASSACSPARACNAMSTARRNSVSSRVRFGGVEHHLVGRCRRARR